MSTYSIILTLINVGSIVFIALAIRRLTARLKALNDRIKMDQLSRAYGGTFRVQPVGTNQLRAQIVKLDEIIAKKDAKLLKRGRTIARLRDGLTQSRTELFEVCDTVREHEKTIESLSVTSDALSLENEKLKSGLRMCADRLEKNGLGKVFYKGVDLATDSGFKCDSDESLDSIEFQEDTPIINKEIIRTSTAYNGDRIDWFKETISEADDTPRKPYVFPERDCIGHISTTNETVKSDIVAQEIKPKITMHDILAKQGALLGKRDGFDNPIKAELKRLGVKYSSNLKPEQYEDYYKFLTELPEKVKKS